MKLLLAAAICAAAVPCLAQDMSLRYGLWGAVNINVHSASFSALPGVENCCTLFESGSGIAGGGGALLDIPISARSLVAVRAGFSMYDASLTATENKLVANRNGTGLVGGVIEHNIDAALPALGAEVLFGYKITERLTAYTGVHGDMLMRATFGQKETLLEPSYGTFENDSRVRNERSGDIPGAASTLAFAVVGAGYETPLNTSKTLVAAPEIMLMAGLTSLAEGVSWKAHGIRVGLAIKYTPPVVEPTMPTPFIIDEPLPKEELVTAEPYKQPAAPVLALNIAGVLPDGTERKQSVLRIEEVVVTNLTPLLGYVFFDAGSAVLPERYKRLAAADTAAFREESIKAANAIDLYRHILDIVGRRLCEMPAASITLTGCASKVCADPNSTLARQRAEAVKDYFVSVWNIAPSRIRLASRSLPAQASNSAHTDGREENRRVEITSDNPDVLGPVVLRDTVRVPYPPLYKVRPVASGQPVSSWTLSVSQNGEIVDEVSGSGAWPAAVDIPIARAVEKLSVKNGGLSLTAKARRDGRVAMAAAEEIPIEWMTLETKTAQKLADRAIDKYSLLLFNFDDAELDEASAPIVELVRKRITPASTLEITGYTDRTGEAEYNRRLSAQRAAHTAEALGVPDARSEGRGNDVLLFANDTPEGRFYCRTVTITVETPVSR